MGTTTRFHIARWIRQKGGEYAKICNVCGLHFESTLRTMLDELIMVPRPDGCCEVRKLDTATILFGYL